MREPVLRLILLIAMILIMTPLLGGCQDGTPPAETTPGTTAEVTPSPEPQSEDLGIFMSIHPDPGGLYDNPKENRLVLDYITQDILQKLNVKIDGDMTFYPVQTFEEQLKSALASGAAVDAFSGSLTMMPEFIERPGLVRSLDELLQQRGPALLELLPEEAFAAVRKNGKILALPGYSLPQNHCTFIRSDLLEELDLALPTTLEDLDAACYKLRKNGYKYPLAMTLYQLERTWMAAWNCPNNVYLDEEGILWPKEYHPNYESFIRAMEHFYDRNYLPRDFSTTTEEEQRDRIIKGTAAIYEANYQSAPSDFMILKESAPTARMEVLPNPIVEGITTTSQINTGSPVKGMLMFLNSGRHPEALMVLRNWTAQSQTSAMVMEWGVPDVHMRFNPDTATLEYPLPPYDQEGGAYYRALTMDTGYGGLYPPAQSGEEGQLASNAYTYLTSATGVWSNLPPFPVTYGDEASDAKDLYERRVRAAANAYIEGDMSYSRFSKLLKELRPTARIFCDEIAAQQ